jgi:hypothetical protein
VSGQLLQKPRMKSSGVCVVSCTAFRGSDRFTAIVLIRQRQAIRLIQPDGVSGILTYFSVENLAVTAWIFLAPSPLRAHDDRQVGHFGKPS